MSTSAANPVDNTCTIECKECGGLIHSVAAHLKNNHCTTKDMTVEQYKAKHPGAPLLSPWGEHVVAENRRKKAEAEAASVKAVSADSVSVGLETKIEPFHELFGLGSAPAARGHSGAPIPITVIKSISNGGDLVPEIDPDYVFNLDLLKTALMGIELRIPAYSWGHAGTGKSTLWEQIAARTGRPMLRVQHTANMEEEHVIGGWRLRDGKTLFDLGPLAMAMKYGWLYLADEYDFGRPEVLSLYQPVLEGKPLIIKEADLENRIIRPHPQFRFVATGNTNGQGDESGLYAGTTLQNAANYERFGIVVRVDYMAEDIESTVVSKKARVPMADAKKLVDYANRIRKEFDSGNISNPISPRSLIYAAQLGGVRSNYITGLKLAFINRLGSVDREAALQVATRVFG